MGTFARKFYPHTTDHDAAFGTDVRKLNDTSGNTLTATTVADFGTTTAVGTIVFDPYTTRTTRGTTDEPNLGWAINLGPDGMDGRGRLVPGGTWTFNTQVSTSTAQTVNTSTMRAVVYRVDINSNRTELFRAAAAPVAISAITGTTRQTINWTGTHPTVRLLPGETLMVSLQVQSQGVTLTGRSIALHTIGTDADGANTWVDLPGPLERFDPLPNRPKRRRVRRSGAVRYLLRVTGRGDTNTGSGIAARVTVTGQPQPVRMSGSTHLTTTARITPELRTAGHLASTTRARGRTTDARHILPDWLLLELIGDD